MPNLYYGTKDWGLCEIPQTKTPDGTLISCVGHRAMRLQVHYVSLQ